MTSDLKITSNKHETAVAGELIHFDASQLERLKILWKFGAWDKLKETETRDLLGAGGVAQSRALVLIATGKAQSGELEELSKAKALLKIARASGLPRREIYNALISGVFNSLARAQVICGQEQQAVASFARSVSCLEDQDVLEFTVRARIQEQIKQIPVPVSIKSELIDQCLLSVNENATTRVSNLVKKCIGATDIHDAIDSLVRDKQLEVDELIDFYLGVSDYFWQSNDKLTALNFLQNAAESAHVASKAQKQKLIDKFISQGKPDLATEIAFSMAFMEQDALELSKDAKTAIVKSFQEQQKKLGQNSEHGHDLLLAYLKLHLNEIRQKAGKSDLTIIEIGTTRENVPGQGSTRKIAEFCKANKLQFKTVDMDPHNSNIAKDMFAAIGTSEFEAITSKGEDYLRKENGPYDFVFLDAYDFDHGMHSQLRQSRYVKYLGAPIDDTECHLMHLDCAKSIKEKLAPHGLVCVDDTWLENGEWTAKGTLAMPYLLDNGFKLLEARNRAALLARCGA